MTTKEEKEIVLARLRTMPPNLRMSLGSKGTYDKTQMMDEVEKGSELGDFIAQAYLTSIRNFKKGI